MKILSERRFGDDVEVQTRFFISSLESNAERILRAKRSYWGIENRLHWVLDIAFNEDRSRVRKDHAPQNFLPMPPKSRVAKRGILDADQDAMMNAARPTWNGGHLRRRDIMAFRDYAILCFLNSTGCRLGGLAHLTLQDVNLNHSVKRIRKRAYVVEKGNKGRYVFMNDQTIAAMIAWLRVRPPCGSNQVFVGCENGKTDWKELAESGHYGVVKKYAVKSGVASRPDALWSPHQWRHRFGRRWLERGGDLSRLAQLLGHSTSQITSEHYGQLEIDVLQDGYEEIMED